ncbi:PREDICTED: probable 2-oxoglutarate-dependent dioxygenase AOP1 [Lupinus angustifolius]|uniref:probable 2-oxoglutarate-dependent dioxygenase AOP1 n=1 Tax=Lupinus angustifolius TaxID=3871 RepID=UPI00092E57C6|nr:PREDICTED: probable 2-oxoglutarate-dependent dioxygenase AOP1 [Lupinus angustifolius]
MGSQTPSHLPIVDFIDENMKPARDSWLSTCHVVRTALEDHGCLVVRYNKVSPELCRTIVSEMKQLFGLPFETKKQETSDKLFHGYYGQIPSLPLYESFGIEDPLTFHGSQKFTHIMWPLGNDRFRDSINKYAKMLAEIDQVVKKMVFESYGVDQTKCDSLIESGNYLLRCLQYRPHLMDESDLGMQPHTDLTMQSILHQVNNIHGLEVKLKDGMWIVVDPSPSLFVVLAGDGFKVWSNGRIKACEHRVIMNAKNTRYSMGLFSFNGKTLQIPEEVVDEQHPLLYKPFDHFEYLRFFDKEKIRESDLRVKAYCGL